MATIINYFPFVVTPAAVYGSGKIAYKNLFVNAGAVTTATNTAASYPVENVYDWKQYDFWAQNTTGQSIIKLTLPNAEEANYFAVFGHNLNSVVASAKVEYSYNDADWVTVVSEFSPPSNNTILKVFNSVTAKYWRIVITSTTSTAIVAGVMIGESISLERDVSSGFAPPNLAPIFESKVPISENGINLGASVIRMGIKGSINISNLTEQFVRAEWLTLINHFNNGLPAVFCWDIVGHESDTVLIWRSGNVDAPKYQSSKYMSVSLKFEGTL